MSHPLGAALRISAALALVLSWSFSLPWLHAQGDTARAIWLVQEDGPFEVAGAAACLLAALLFLELYLGALRSSSPLGPARPGPLVLLLAVGMGLMFFEEISWGQRLLGFATPQWFDDANIQREFNLHNLHMFHPRLENNWLKLTWLAAGLGYLGLLPLAALVPRVRLWLDRLGLPVAGPAVCVSVWAAYLAYAFNLARATRAGDRFAGHDAGETIECIVEVLMALVAISAVRRAGAVQGPFDRRRRRLLAAVAGAVALVLAVPILGSIGDPVSSFDHLALVRLASAEWSRGELDSAAAHFARALERGGDDPQVRMNLGVIASSRKRTDEAAEHFAAVIRLAPDFFGGYASLGAVRINQGRTPEAIELLGRAIELAPHDASYEARNNLGYAYLLAGQVDQAIEQLEAALAIRPDYALARQNLQAAGAKKAERETVVP